MNNFAQTPPNGRPEPSPKTGCLTAFLLVVGIILLLPGVLCAILLVNMGGSGNDPLTPIVMFVALIGAGLIMWALMNRK